jgi:hypothetical protein
VSETELRVIAHAATKLFFSTVFPLVDGLLRPV